MSGEMCWLSTYNNSTKILHVRNNKEEQWKPYTAMAISNIPDYNIPQGSKGWAAYQRLRNMGWTLVPSPQTTTKDD
jgi:hypothetical protein